MKILFVASEGLPYSKTGGLADVVEGLPRALRELGHEVAVLLPRYRGNKAGSVLVSSVTVALGTQLRFPALVEAKVIDGVRYFFVDDPEYFDRAQLYGDRNGDYADNAERFAEFCRAAVEFVKRVWLPDVIHCHDWQSALVPVLLKTQHANDPAVRSLPTLLTIHNLAYQGVFPRTALDSIGLPPQLFTMDTLEFYGRLNFLKGGLIYSDYLTTVSPRYAREIQTPEFGAGLEGVIRNRGDRLKGILNGVDYAAWSPESDSLIAQNYSVHNMAGKRACKKDILAQFKLPDDLDRPLIGIISRFVDQKGFDIFAEIAEEVARENVSLIAFGTGQPVYEKMFKAYAERHPSKVGVKIGFDNVLAHKIEAGSDIFLMPSRFEPCGLNQIFSLRYGTVPVVRAVGGLDDTVENYDGNGAGSPAGDGFKFTEYSGVELLGAIRRALAAYRNQPVWHSLQANGMSRDFSWKTSAASYVTLYEAAKRSRIPRIAGTSNRR